MNNESFYEGSEKDVPTDDEEHSRVQFQIAAQENVLSRTLKGLDIKKFGFLFSVAILFALHWIFTSELFQVPSDVQESRLLFMTAKEHYEGNKHYWDTKLLNFHQSLQREEKLLDDYEMLHRIQEAAPEIWIAYLIHNVGFDLERLNNVNIFLKKNSVNEFTLPSLSLVISKYEQSIWPFQILLSLELEIFLRSHMINAEATRLRRGAQDLALGLTWAYFGTELEPLKKVQLLTISLSKK